MSPDGGGVRTNVPYPVFTSIRNGLPAVPAAAFQRSAATAVIDGEQAAVNAMLVSPEYFDVLGARPIAGTLESWRPALAGPGAVLSHAFWRAAFGGRRNIIGRRFSVSGVDYLVAAVMPAGFSGHSTIDVDVWLPLAEAMRNTPGWDRDPYRSVASIVVLLRTTTSAGELARPIRHAGSMLIVAAGATLLPARAAARTNPNMLLKVD